MEPSAENSTGEISRRTALKRAGVATAAAAWATPVIQTINMSAAGAQGAGTAVIKAAGAEPLKSITLQYIGSPAAAHSGAPCDGSGASSGATPDDNVEIFVLYGAGGNRRGGIPASNCGGAAGGTPLVWPGSPNVLSGSVQTWGLDEPNTGMNPRITLLVRDPGTGNCTITEIHTSCSTPVNIGDECGQFRVLGGTV